MKIYVDGWFVSIATPPYVFFTDIKEIPNDCDIIAISFYDCDHQKHSNIIHQLKSQCQHLIINISEPTEVHQPLKDLLLEHQDNPNIHFFGDAVLNYSTINWQTNISWFIIPENVYVTKPWAKNLLQQLVPWTQRKSTYMFDGLLGRSRFHRDLISKFWSTSKYQDKIAYSYFHTRDNTNIDYLPHDIGPIDEFHNTIYHGERVNISWMLPVEIYNKSWYSIVAETTFFNHLNQYTEKLCKPILAKRPFIVFAGQNYLKNLRNLGFKTFDSIIDESYDTIDNLQERIEKAWHQVEWLCEQDPHKVYQELESVLEYNQQHFLNTDWHAPAKKIFSTFK